MTHLLGITWNPSEGIDLGFFMIRYYSLMWVTAFGLGWFILKHIFIRENESLEKLDSLFIWCVVATMLGARLGHVIFYQSELFVDDPLSILLPIRTVPEFKFTGFAGLASHGAAIGIVMAMIYFSKKIMKKPLMWVLDRVVIPVASGAVIIRLGNFFNSEIYGNVTSNNFYAVKFIKEEEFWQQNGSVQQITKAATPNEGYDLIQNDPRFIDTLNAIPFRHPAQMYEAICYVFVFAILFFLYWKTDARQKQGFLFGMFMILLWSIRFVVETVKASQGGIETSLHIFSTGQWLSIPMIIVGIYYVFSSKKVEIV
jgi:phosphatidylglycerol---prolipoprotein diacylglyceryl transferase